MIDIKSISTPRKIEAMANRCSQLSLLLTALLLIITISVVNGQPGKWLISEPNHAVIQRLIAVFTTVRRSVPLTQ